MQNAKPLIFALMAALPIASAAAAGMNFQMARGLMHERADLIRVSAADVEQKRFEVKEARSLSGPKVSLNAQQIEGRKDVHLGFDNPLSALGPALQLPIPNRFNIDYEDDISGPRASLDVVWPLYTGGAISAKQEATQAAVREALAGLDKTKDELDTLLVQKYFGVQLARSVEKLRQDMLAQEERDLKRAVRFEKAGMLAKIERMGAQVNRDAAQREVLSAQANRQVAERELQQLLKEDRIGELDTPLFVCTSIKSLDYWTDLALNHNPLLKSIQAQQDQARMGVKAARGAYHPKVYLFGHYNMIDHYLTLPEPDWIAGIGVSITLWDNRDRSARVGSAQALVNKAQAARDQAESEIRKVVEVAWLRSQEALDQYRLTSSSIDLAKENVRLRESSFKEGLCTVDDVNDARNKLIAAEVARRVASYRFVVAYSMLHAASGRMIDFLDVLSRPDIVIAR